MEQKEKKYEGAIDAGRSVLDIAADMEKRKGFLRHLEATGKKLHEPEQYAETEAYVLSDDCVRDLKSALRL